MKLHRACLLAAALFAMNATAAPSSVFFSGHSLLESPLPEEVARIAGSLGLAPVKVRVHVPAGSSLRDRLAAGRIALPGPGVDALVVTEQHTLVGNLVWNDSVGQLRRLQAAFAADNPQGRTWLYASWLPLDDAARPQRWVGYERSASPVWQCLAGAVPGVAILPAAAVLAGIVEQLARGGVPGLGASALFRDDVHLSPMGAHVMALVVFGALFERSPEGAAPPAGIEPTIALALQRLAWQGLRAELARLAAGAAADCGDRARDFVGPYAAYVRDVIDRPQLGAVRAWGRWLRHRLIWHWALRKGLPGN